ATHPPVTTTPSTTVPRIPEEAWRGRTTKRDVTTPRIEAPRTVQPAPAGDPRSDIARRIIERIGGARIYGEPHRDNPPKDSTPSTRAPASTSQPQPQPQPQPANVNKSSPPKESNPSPPPPSRSNDGGKVKRDH